MRVLFFSCSLIFVLLLRAQIVQCAPKTVAIVNLSTSPGSEQAAAMARTLINASQELQTTNQGDLARALEQTFPEGGPDGVIFEQVTEALQASEHAFAAFKGREARAKLTLARTLLLSLRPSPKSNQRLADVSLQMALIHLRDENRGLAMREFHLLHRLDARNEIDPVRYAPEVVDAFHRSKPKQIRPPTPPAHLSISATYDGPVYVDGKLVGSTPLQWDVTPGSHIVSIAPPQYQAIGQVVELDAGGQRQIRFELQPRSPVVQVLEMRFEAKELGLAEEHLRRVASRVARLVGSDAVMVILDKDGSPVAALYDQRLDRLSYSRSVDADLYKLLGLVIETERPAILEGPRPPAGVPWYRKPFGIAAIGGGTALTVGILGILVLRGDDATDTIDFTTRTDWEE